MSVLLGTDVLKQYYRFSLYNSPYTAHDEGCAIDLYPAGDHAPSPVAGTVLETRTVEAPPKPYAAARDHLILIDTGEYVARTLHVDPAVEAGERVTVGDPLGRLVRAGFFAPWVPNHIHLGFRAHGTNYYRASGSLPVSVDVPLVGVEWDGTGTVAATGETWARLEPLCEPPEAAFAGLATAGSVLDGGFPHYDSGGLLSPGAEPTNADEARKTPPTIAGTTVGQRSGRTVSWHDCTVRVNGTWITGIALYCARDAFAIKLVGEALDCRVGEAVEVRIERRQAIS